MPQDPILVIKAMYYPCSCWPVSYLNLVYIERCMLTLWEGENLDLVVFEHATLRYSCIMLLLSSRGRKVAQECYVPWWEHQLATKSAWNLGCRNNVQDTAHTRRTDLHAPPAPVSFHLQHRQASALHLAGTIKLKTSPRCCELSWVSH